MDITINHKIISLNFPYYGLQGLHKFMEVNIATPKYIFLKHDTHFHYHVYDTQSHSENIFSSKIPF